MGIVGVMRISPYLFLFFSLFPGQTERDLT